MSGFFAGGRFWDMTAAQEAALATAAATLSNVGISDAVKEARMLWVHAAADEGVFASLIARRAARAPLSHLLGYRDFYDHRFIVTPDVLDPRPDTESVVAAALDQPFSRVLDLGTGSGCILLSLLAAHAQATGLGVDISDAALAVAAQNRTTLGLDDRATLARSDWFGAVTGTFDLIVSNPPYIAADEMAGLQPEVRLFEPHLALTDDADGLSCYRIIAAGAAAHLVPGGRLIVEIGPTQAAAVKALFASAGLTDLRVIPDLDGRDRGIAGRWPGPAA
ncbi:MULTISPECIES: peptide chain release factor N(5)-glutamine methyltransferase [unclassified Yoonia]|uniref:peptide chain release factor N(5)-glutamine methyltransferase n=1 Tax=unclassified Yoonia TaxID=2629118 RepID=UPI002AFE0269|nr:MULTISPECIES: peptide chain release factor N(5)-glutamine methyltransferase [unclassified Yoonia]